MIDRAQFDRLRALKRETLTVELPGREAIVFGVREFSAADAEWWSAQYQLRRDGETFNWTGLRASLLQRVVCDGDGKPFWQPNEIEAISELPDDVCEAMYSAVRNYLKMDKDSRQAEEEEDAEEQEKKTVGPITIAG